MEWVNLLAIALSPIVAVVVSMWIQERRERRLQKLHILATLIGGRHDPLTIENVRALNMIDFVFHDRASVRRLWREYLEMLCNEGLNNEVGWEQLKQKRNELITALASALGYGKAINHLDVDRVYIPKGVVNDFAMTRALWEELLRVLKNTDSLAARQRRSGSSQRKSPQAGAQDPSA